MPSTSPLEFSVNGFDHLTVNSSSYKDNKLTVHGQQLPPTTSTEDDNFWACVSRASVQADTPSADIYTPVSDNSALHVVSPETVDFSAGGTPALATSCEAKTIEPSRRTRGRHHPYTRPAEMRRKRSSRNGGSSSSSSSSSSNSDPASTNSDARSTHCDQCGKNFNRWQDTDRHVDEVHSEVKFPCPRCGVDYCRRDVLQKHLSKHGSKCKVDGEPSQINMKVPTSKGNRGRKTNKKE